MNIRKNGIDKSMNSKDDEGALEKIAKKIAPPSREVSDAQLIDPGANTPETTPNRPAKSLRMASIPPRSSAGQWAGSIGWKVRIKPDAFISLNHDPAEPG